MAKPAMAVFYYQVYIHRWRGSETRASTNLEQRGLLWELLFHAAAEGSLPMDHSTLANIANCSRSEFARAWPKIKDRFIERDGRLHHVVVDEELARMADLQSKRSEGGRTGAKKRWVSHGSPNGSPNGSVVANVCQIGDRKQDIGDSTHTTVWGELAERIYRAHPKKQGKVLAEQALAQAVSEANLTEADIPAIEAKHTAWCASRDWTKSDGQFAPTLAAWIQRQGWRDDPPPSQEDKW